MIHRTRLSNLVSGLLGRNFASFGDWLFRGPDETARDRGWTTEPIYRGLGRRYHDPGLPARLARHAVATVPVRAGPPAPPPPESAANARAWARWSR